MPPLSPLAIQPIALENLYRLYRIRGERVMTKLGIEVARRRLPELVAAAHRGDATLITRHGQPCAALVPASMLDAVRRPPVSLLALKGRAAGLWGKRPARTVAALREEWGE